MKVNELLACLGECKPRFYFSRGGEGLAEVWSTAEALRDDPKEMLLWRCVYAVAVAVYHLLLDKVKYGQSKILEYVP